jgi:hypothetical protein
MDSLLDRHLGVEFGRHFLKATNAYAPAFEAIGKALDGQAKRAFLGSAEKHGEPKSGSPARQVGMGVTGPGRTRTLHIEKVESDLTMKP